ncbi:uncharacterized protein LOC135815111 [Sycon ciliatum]|uniref:uncharacterized protein LOC135815111 n=1 Tax=Sycon ciliatum TaxID=27933 RepID=UPI0020AECA5D|eukprot:scpid86867/ scgid17393/ 
MLAHLSATSAFVAACVWSILFKNVLGQVCVGTGLPPRKTLGLVFCRRFSDNACCTPALDAENEEMFGNLVNVGSSCRVRGNVRNHPMAEFYCLNCDPNQPQFLVNSTVYICKEWADDKFGTGSELFTKYNLDQCGLYAAGACPGRDRYQCGDDLILPAPNASSDAGVDIVRTVSELLNFANLGPPLFEEGYTFSIVAKAELPAGVTACYGSASALSPMIALLTLSVFLVAAAVM